MGDGWSRRSTVKSDICFIVGASASEKKQMGRMNEDW